MRISEPPTRPAAAPKTGRRGLENYSGQILRAKKRRLQELGTENYREAKIDVPPAFIKGNQARPGKTVNTRRVLGLKRSLANVFDDDTTGSAYHASLTAKPSKYPAKHRCAVCGYFGNTVCTKCGSRSCSLRCSKAHQCVS